VRLTGSQPYGPPLPVTGIAVPVCIAGKSGIRKGNKNGRKIKRKGMYKVDRRIIMGCNKVEHSKILQKFVEKIVTF
jgi:hypothetical protein